MENKDIETKIIGTPTSQTYLLVKDCANCGYHNVFNVPKGKTVYDFLKLIKCQNCGCNVQSNLIPM